LQAQQHLQLQQHEEDLDALVGLDAAVGLEVFVVLELCAVLDLAQERLSLVEASLLEELVELNRVTLEKEVLVVTLLEKEDSLV